MTCFLWSAKLNRLVSALLATHLPLGVWLTVRGLFFAGVMQTSIVVEIVSSHVQAHCVSAAPLHD